MQTIPDNDDIDFAGDTSSSSTAEASTISSSISHFIILSAKIYYMIFRIRFFDYSANFKILSALTVRYNVLDDHLGI
jgi:hypothetical protein